MSHIANTGPRGRTLLWLGIAAAIVAIAIFRIPLGTVLYLGVFLALPFLMMRMHGGGHAGGSGCGDGHGGSSDQDDRTPDLSEAPATHQH